MEEFHRDVEGYFHMQYLTARDHIIPYLKQFMDLSTPLRILEVGCGEAGVLKAFHEQGHDCTGIELESHRIERAEKLLAQEIESGRMRFIVKNIYDIDPQQDHLELFDLIILKDVIEHIPQQEKIMPELKKLSAPGGFLFFAFPPWQMPFGGHQQVLKDKKLSKLPWMHLLPERLYRKILLSGGDQPSLIEELIELKHTGITIEKFSRIASRTYEIINQKLYLINPIYQYKFKVKPLATPPVLRNLPLIRNFYSTCAYFLLRNKS